MVPLSSADTQAILALTHDRQTVSDAPRPGRKVGAGDAAPIEEAKRQIAEYRRRFP